MCADDLQTLCGRLRAWASLLTCACNVRIPVKLLVAFFYVRQTSGSSEHSRAGHLRVQDASVPCRRVWAGEPDALMWRGADSWRYSHAVSKHITLHVPTPPEPPTSIATESEGTTEIP